MKKTKIIRCQSRICVGGPAFHTIFLSHGLNSDKYETLLVGGNNNSDEKSMLPLADKLGVRYKIIKEMGRDINFLDDLISLYKLYRLIRKEKPTIVHTHTAKAGTIGRIAAFLARVPYIYHTFHGHVFKGYFSNTLTGFYIYIERLLAKLSTKIVVISAAQKTEIVQEFKIAPQNKVVEIPLGFNWEDFLKPSYYKLRDRFQIPEDKYLIAIIGRIVPVKNHMLFMEIAFKLLQRDLEKYHFMIIGDGDLKNELQEILREKNYAQHFTFTGWLELSKDAYQNIDLLLLTSLNEGTPVTIIEALAAGTPVIAADVGGVRDVMSIWDANKVVGSNKSQDYVEKIISLEEENLRINEKVCDEIRHKYSVERLVKDIERLYQAD